MAVYAPCDDCGGELIVGRFDDITVPKLDALGNPVVGPQGPETITLRLPWHRNMAVVAVERKLLNDAAQEAGQELPWPTYEAKAFDARWSASFPKRARTPDA
jgi:hypothetical protein